jgi:hypothetical protein
MNAISLIQDIVFAIGPSAIFGLQAAIFKPIVWIREIGKAVVKDDRVVICRSMMRWSFDLETLTIGCYARLDFYESFINLI